MKRDELDPATLKYVAEEQTCLLIHVLTWMTSGMMTFERLATLLSPYIRPENKALLTLLRHIDAAIARNALIDLYGENNANRI